MLLGAAHEPWFAELLAHLLAADPRILRLLRDDPFDGPGAAMDLVLKLGAVLALAYVSMAALKRYTSGSVSQRGSTALPQ